MALHRDSFPAMGSKKTLATMISLLAHPLVVFENPSRNCVQGGMNLHILWTPWVKVTDTLATPHEFEFKA